MYDIVTAIDVLMTGKYKLPSIIKVTLPKLYMFIIRKHLYRKKIS